MQIWLQPRDLNFNTRKEMLGLGIDLNGAYKFFSTESRKSLYANVGISAKTKGFLLENPNLDSHFKIQMGIIYKTKIH